MKYQAIAMLLATAQVSASSCPPQGQLFKRCVPFKDLDCTHQYEPPLDDKEQAALG